MYSSSRISFRPVEKGDLEELRSLRNDMSTQLQLGSVGMESEQSQVSWWERGLLSEKQQRYTLLRSDTGEIVGMARILNIDHMNANCEIGLDIVPRLRGKGLGYQSYLCLLEYLFLQKNMNMVYLKVIKFNTAAQKLYQKIGFEKTGFLKNYIFRFGKYWDYEIMCLERSVFSKGKKPYLPFSSRRRSSVKPKLS